PSHAILHLCSFITPTPPRHTLFPYTTLFRSQQNTFHKVDSAVPMAKQEKMMEVILYLHHRAKSLIQWGMPMSYLNKSNIFTDVINMKYTTSNDNLADFDHYFEDIDTFYENAMQENG